MKISIASDHAGFEYKSHLLKKLKEWGYDSIDIGPHSADSVDYPDFAHPLALSLEKKESDLGILICGSGNGVCMTANKHKNIRAALCWNKDLARLARQHNDANVICLPARFISKRLATLIVQAFLTSEFEGGRHANRVNKIGCI
jgi:ribose 5-phosphate isomerase B